MTTYYIERKTNEALIEIKGHAGCGTSGHDIVCAAISTACYMTANLIDKLDLRYNILDLVCEDGYFRLQVKTDNHVVSGIFDNLEEHIIELHNQYPKYLKMKK
jgi:hypothetical protein